MTEKKFYGVFNPDGSPNAFYVDDIYPPQEDGSRHAAIPEAAIEVSEQIWIDLLDGQPNTRYAEGKVLKVAPKPIPEPEPSPVEVALDKIMKRLDALEAKK